MKRGPVSRCLRRARRRARRRRNRSRSRPRRPCAWATCRCRPARTACSGRPRGSRWLRSLERGPHRRGRRCTSRGRPRPGRPWAARTRSTTRPTGPRPEHEVEMEGTDVRVVLGHRIGLAGALVDLHRAVVAVLGHRGRDEQQGHDGHHGQPEDDPAAPDTRPRSIDDRHDSLPAIAIQADRGRLNGRGLAEGAAGEPSCARRAAAVERFGRFPVTPGTVATRADRCRPAPPRRARLRSRRSRGR